MAASCTIPPTYYRNPDEAMSQADRLFRQVLDDYGPALARLARVYEREPGRAEDLHQEICLALWKALPGWRRQASLRTFVFRIAHNRGISHGRREQLRTTLPLDEAVETVDPSPNAEVRAGHRQRREHLLAAVRELPLGLRQAVSLKLEGLSGPEIADILDLSPGAVRVRLHRAQQTLKDRLGEST